MADRDEFQCFHHHFSALSCATIVLPLLRNASKDIMYSEILAGTIVSGILTINLVLLFGLFTLGLFRLSYDTSRDCVHIDLPSTEVVNAGRSSDVNATFDTSSYFIVSKTVQVDLVVSKV